MMHASISRGAQALILGAMGLGTSVNDACPIYDTGLNLRQGA
jgi:hypothetical protein